MLTQSTINRCEMKTLFTHLIAASIGAVVITAAWLATMPVEIITKHEISYVQIPVVSPPEIIHEECKPIHKPKIKPHRRVYKRPLKIHPDWVYK